MITWESLVFIEVAVVIIIGLVSYYFDILTFDGFIGGLVIGVPIIVFGGFDWFLLLMLFLISGSALTKIGKRKKIYFSVVNDKSGTRAWPNVIANGLWPMLAALLHYFLPWSTPELYWTLFYIGALSSMMADTTSTEIGMLSPEKPRLIYNPRKTVEVGVSGGVTLLGTVTGILSTLAFALVGYLIIREAVLIRYLLAIVLAGSIGNISDSFFGAIIQAKYMCIECGKIVETPLHCGRESRKIRGYEWVNNHTINFLSSFVGGLLAIVFYVFFP